MDPSLTYTNNGRIEALITGHLTLYLTAFDEAANQGYVEGYERAMALLRDKIRWYRTDAMRFNLPLTQWTLDGFPIWFKPGTPPCEDYGLYLSSGTDADAIGPWGFEFWLAPYELPDYAGFFHLIVPSEMLHDEPETFLALVRELADVIPFRSGHAGFGIQYDEGDALEDRDARIRLWAHRYAGVDCRDLSCATLEMAHAVKSVNWLTLLDADFVDQLGGLDALGAKLSPPIMMEQRAHGVIIQAGPTPLLGDVNRREDLSLYKQVHAAIQPLLAPTHLSFPGFSEDETEAWLNRFDDR